MFLFIKTKSYSGPMFNKDLGLMSHFEPFSISYTTVNLKPKLIFLVTLYHLFLSGFISKPVFVSGQAMSIKKAAQKDSFFQRSL